MVKKKTVHDTGKVGQELRMLGFVLHYEITPHHFPDCTL
jgi:hypothetical protein